MSYSLKNIKKSNKAQKKFMATFSNKENGREKTIHFGAAGYRDFTLINNKSSKFYIEDPKKRIEVRTAYQRRHMKDLSTEAGRSGVSAGALSFFILWTGKTFKSGLTNYKKKYKL